MLLTPSPFDSLQFLIVNATTYSYQKKKKKKKKKKKRRKVWATASPLNFSASKPIKAYLMTCNVDMNDLTAFAQFSIG
nr:unnamed protein product [Spirometra erinaceieuropaei]